jgi:hypothetical protein
MLAPSQTSSLPMDKASRILEGHGATSANLRNYVNAPECSSFPGRTVFSLWAQPHPSMLYLIDGGVEVRFRPIPYPLWKRGSLAFAAPTKTPLDRLGFSGILPQCLCSSFSRQLAVDREEMGGDLPSAELVWNRVNVDFNAPRLGPDQD